MEELSWDQAHKTQFATLAQERGRALKAWKRDKRDNQKKARYKEAARLLRSTLHKELNEDLERVAQELQGQSRTSGKEFFQKADKLKIHRG